MSSADPVLITGAVGRVGGALRVGLAGRCPLRLFDIRAASDLRPGEEMICEDIGDLPALKAAAADCRAIVHLAGLTVKMDHEALLNVNLRGTYHALEAAVSAGCDRFVFASTNHVTGFYPVDVPVTPDMPPRPDSLYGASKAYGEALGRFYHDRYGLGFAAIRIGSALPAPTVPRSRHTWISDPDLAQLVWRCLSAPELGFLVVYGGSGNRQSYWVDAEQRRSIGYVPADSADDAELGPDVPDRFQGGPNVGPLTAWRHSPCLPDAEPTGLLELAQG
jgi:uronate dehydrogenase